MPPLLLKSSKIMDFDRLKIYQKEYPNLPWSTIQRVLKTRDQACWEGDLSALSKGTPWEYLVKSATFGPIELFIEPPLLVPRDDTWDWVEKAFPKLQFQRACDLGTGPGTLSLALAYFHGPHINITAIDNDLKALEVSRINFQRHNLSNATILHSDWGATLIQKKEKFDLIISNPPYCDEATALFIENSPENIHARVANFAGYAPYVHIFSSLNNILEHSGVILLEHGSDQGYNITRLANFFGLNRTQLFKDSQGAWRASMFKWNIL